jgi:p-cumate 2,3-dioxygenase alpha subunit
MEIRNLIIDKPSDGIFKVHRSTMTSLDVLELERKRIFDQCWLYVGHESEVENRGDYRRRTVSGRPVIFVRGSDGVVRALLNTCTHRGTTLCRQSEGTAETFQCFYHGWTFSNKGNLVGVPDAEGYSKDFDRTQMGLKSPPRIDSYRGFYFISFNPANEDLVTHLGGATECIDLVVDQSEKGMRVVPGSQKYGVQANWKLLVENSMDGYHALPTHQTYFSFLNSLGTKTSGEIKAASTPRALGNGHNMVEVESFSARPIAHWGPIFREDAKEDIAKVRARLVQRYGEERAYRIADTIRNLLIYPYLFINDNQAVMVRQLNPISPSYTEVEAWFLAPKEETEDQLARRLDSGITFLGPGGFSTPDDVEAVESCQEGFHATDVEWSDISRGMHRTPRAQDEEQMRIFWRHWRAQMTGAVNSNGYRSQDRGEGHEKAERVNLD